jgi:hypothetical protein
MNARVIHFLRPTFAVLILFALVVGTANAIWIIAGEALTSGAAVGSAVPELEQLSLSQIVLPSTELTPDAVVRLQAAGLSEHRPDAVGVLQCYAFASPANRAVTGPLDRFGKMVRQGAFECMARPQAMLIGRPQITDRIARVLVTMIDDQHRLHAFTFVLARQREAPFKDCWMTEAVLPSLPVAMPSPPAIPAA